MNINRIRHLKIGIFNPKSTYILYWMQQSQRVAYNHALNHAISVANQKNLPLLVVFGLTPAYPEANARHYTFMLEGIKEVRQELKRHSIEFVFKIGHLPDVIYPFLNQADTLVFDQGYLRHQRQWRDRVMEYIHRLNLELSVDSVETDVIVPVSIASQKAEYGAYTIRHKLHYFYSSFRDYDELPTLVNTTVISQESDDDLSDISKLVLKLSIDQSIRPSTVYHGGHESAKQTLDEFISNVINTYPLSNDPSLNNTSKLSLYLHYGQISSLEILEVLIAGYHQKRITQEAYLAFFEQLLVRRELAFNYVTYQEGYDCFDGMTEPWAYETMKQHNSDVRPIVYHDDDIIQAKTHDPYFNAAMSEMVITGYMHNYMRMYWAKKLIEWSPSFQSAYERIIRLNNTYFIDGRDPNSYAGIAWCFGKHDRAWTERSIFGKLRYMNDKGLVRKFDMDAYLQRIQTLKESECSHDE